MIPRKSLILVDEDLDDIELFLEAIKIVDASIISKTVNSTNQALVILLNDQPLPDWIFIDIVMKRSEGIPFLRHVRSLLAFDHIPIIIHSASLSRTHEQEIARLDNTKYLAKPSNFKTLCNSLSDIIFPPQDKKSMA